MPSGTNSDSWLCRGLFVTDHHCFFLSIQKCWHESRHVCLCLFGGGNLEHLQNSVPTTERDEGLCGPEGDGLHDNKGPDHSQWAGVMLSTTVPTSGDSLKEAGSDSLHLLVSTDPMGCQKVTPLYLNIRLIT